MQPNTVQYLFVLRNKSRNLLRNDRMTDDGKSTCICLLWQLHKTKLKNNLQTNDNLFNSEYDINIKTTKINYPILILLVSTSELYHITRTWSLTL